MIIIKKHLIDVHTTLCKKEHSIINNYCTVLIFKAFILIHKNVKLV